MHVSNCNWYEDGETIKKIFFNVWQKMEDMTEKVTEIIKNAVKDKFEQAKEIIRSRLEDAKQYLIDKFNEMKQNAINKAQEILTNIRNKFNEIKTNITNKLQEAKTALVNRFTEMVTRSEEHTSELQSRGHLVCRLLLEKKNYYKVKFLVIALRLFQHRKTIIIISIHRIQKINL